MKLSEKEKQDIKIYNEKIEEVRNTRRVNHYKRQDDDYLKEKIIQNIKNKEHQKTHLSGFWFLFNVFKKYIISKDIKTLQDDLNKLNEEAEKRNQECEKVEKSFKDWKRKNPDVVKIGELKEESDYAEMMSVDDKVEHELLVNHGVISGPNHLKSPIVLQMQQEEINALEKQLSRASNSESINKIIEEIKELDEDWKPKKELAFLF